MICGWVVSECVDTFVTFAIWIGLVTEGGCSCITPSLSAQDHASCVHSSDRYTLNAQHPSSLSPSLSLSLSQTHTHTHTQTILFFTQTPILLFPSLSTTLIVSLFLSLSLSLYRGVTHFFFESSETLDTEYDICDTRRQRCKKKHSAFGFGFGYILSSSASLSLFHFSPSVISSCSIQLCHSVIYV